jgi:hypothetical protein
LTGVILDITGYPGIAKAIPVSAVPAAGPLQRVVLSSSAQSAAGKGRSDRAGVVMATLDLEKEKGATMLVGPGLREYTNKRSIGEVMEDDVGAQRPDGGPIPIGNGQVVRGL